MSAKEWLAFLGGVFGYVIAIIVFFYRIFVDKRIKAIKGRLIKTTVRLRVQSGKHHHIENFMKNSTREHGDLHEDIGKLYNSISNINDNMHKLELKWLDEVSSIRTRVSEIQTKLDLVLHKLD